MPFVGTGHIWMLVILGLVAVMVFGPKKLPELGSGLGRAIREFRQAMSAVTAPVHAAAADTIASPPAGADATDD